MQKYNCIIVEDEPLAAEVLQDYISQVPFLELVKVCSDAIYAMEVLQQEKIDLVFLDIHLPKLKGIDFIKVLNQYNIYAEVKTFENAPHSFCLFDPWFQPTVNYIDDFLKRVFK